MTLKVHGSPYSTCNERVLLILHEKGVPYERITLDFEKAEQKAPEYLKLQPFGKVPVLEDDGFFVYESRAIVRYLAMKYAGQGTKLMPDPNDLKAYALFEQVQVDLD
jgi:glutathione S-transferase